MIALTWISRPTALYIQSEFAARLRGGDESDRRVSLATGANLSEHSPPNYTAGVDTVPDPQHRRPNRTASDAPRGSVETTLRSGPTARLCAPRAASAQQTARPCASR